MDDQLLAERLDRINENLDKIEAHLDKLNGKVASHESFRIRMEERLPLIESQVERHRRSNLDALVVLQNEFAALQDRLQEHQSYIDQRQESLKEFDQVKKDVAQHQSFIDSQRGTTSAWREAASLIGGVMAAVVCLVEVLKLFHFVH